MDFGAREGPARTESVLRSAGVSAAAASGVNLACSAALPGKVIDTTTFMGR